MSLFDSILGQARRSLKRIVLPEGDDSRIVEGAVRAFDDEIAQPVLLGDASTIEPMLEALGCSGSKIEILDPRHSARTEDYAKVYHELRKHKGVTEETALATLREDRLTHAAMMVRLQDADGTIGGAVHTTSDTVRTALQIIGRAEGVRTVSSFFLMLLEQQHHGDARILMFADCALIIQPSVEELAEIALSSSRSFKALVDVSPRVAMLSFSTAGSAKHKRAVHVKEATDLVRKLDPDLLVDGELQFDAAMMPTVSAKKAPDSVLEGDANIFVFPTLEAGNIGYKIAQRIGAADAIGPILQGLVHPANDLSRGCSAEDVYRLLAVTAVQAENGPDSA